MIATCRVTAAGPTPSSMTARTPSMSAVSGKTLMSGWNTSGNRAAEKNTPEQIAIGKLTRFTRPATV